MAFHLYGDVIVAPNKCGTRYLDEICGEYENLNYHTFFEDERFMDSKYIFIYRNPMDWLVSALHTEIIGISNQSNHDPQRQSVSDVIGFFMDEFGTTHWQRDILKRLSQMRNIEEDKRIRAVELPHLTELVSDLGWKNVPYKKEKYTFSNLKNFRSKEAIVEEVKNGFPNEWKFLMECVESEMRYYKFLQSENYQ